jgi:hypothetical protein
MVSELSRLGSRLLRMDSTPSFGMRKTLAKALARRSIHSLALLFMVTITLRLRSSSACAYSWAYEKRLRACTWV